MKLDKRKCREYAAPDRKLSFESGIFHVKQLSYIITTAVKTIAHHRTLVLYIYQRKQASKGDCKPLWTMFQTKDNFLTLERREDGSTVWRTAAFAHLIRNVYNYSSQCAFYSNQDERRVLRYFKADTNADGLQALVSAQDAILKRSRKKRQLIKEKAIAARMAGLPALPRGLKSYVKSIMPAYFFYDYHRSKDISGICSACGKEITLSGIKQGSKAICPHCKHELTAKPRSRRGSNMYDRETFEVIQSMGDGLVVRIIKAYYSYIADTPRIEIYENARQFIYLDADDKLCTEHYYDCYHSGITTDWKKGIRPVYIQYQYHFEGDTCGYLYTENLPGALSGTPWQYCTIADFYNHFHERMQVLPFLKAHLEHPRLEHLCKMGFYGIVADLAYHNDGENLDETQNRTHQILKIAAEDVSFLCNLDADLATLKTFQDYAGTKDRQQLLTWQLENDVKDNILPILAYITVHKLIRYAERQFLYLCQHKNRYGSIRYQKIFERDGMKIVVPATPGELASEGNALHHCVGSYGGRVAKKECMILFLRHCSDETKPYYTIEVRGQGVVQVRGVGNCEATPEVQKFIDAFRLRVLQGSTDCAA